jgi:hypothetical protein
LSSEQKGGDSNTKKRKEKEGNDKEKKRFMQRCSSGVGLTKR